MSLNIFVLGPSMYEGLASSQRLRNNLMPLTLIYEAKIINLDIHSKLSNKAIEQDFQLTPITYYSFNNFTQPLRFPYYLLKGIRLINKSITKDRKNIFFVYGYPNIVNILFILFAKKYRYHIVFDIVEDNFVKTHYRSTVNKIKNISSIMFIRYLNVLADDIFVISNHLKKLVEKHGYKKRIIRIPISINYADFKDVIKSKNNCPLKIFYGGSYGNKDGLEILLKALYEIVRNDPSNLRLILTGKGSDRNMKKFWSLIDKLKLNKYIDFKGLLPYSDYIKELKNADILCMTRVNSEYANAGFPFKLGEFLASGNPVISSKVGEIEDYLTSKDAILIPPGDPKKLEDAILYLMNDIQMRKKIGENGRKVALTNFNSNIISKEIYKILTNT